MPAMTFLFTDIEESSRLWEQFPQAMSAALERHDRLLRQVIEENDGQVVKSTGDGLLAAFPSAHQAARASIEAQLGLGRQEWGETGPLRVRMGMNYGEAELRQGDYFGNPVNRAARLMSLANGGQVLLANLVASLLADHIPEGAHLVDLGEHRLKDLQRPERVYQLVSVGMQEEFPALKSVQRTPNNLPTQLTSFIGRDEEIDLARGLLSQSRLVTFTGPGGTGKTRLSIQVAAELQEHYPDGTWLVELSTLTGGEQLPQAIAAAMDIQEQAGRPLRETILDYLRYKNCLLILDNCEHLVEACARLAQELLQQCTRLSILTSSRELLGVSGESLLRVPPLASPEPLPAAKPVEAEVIAQLQKFEAIGLFTQRAKEAAPRFQLDEDNAAAVVQICHRLDGIPLALELAAARVRLLTVQQIAQKLDDRFRLLTGGSRTSLPRQQTLQALIDWSWDLLEEGEKALLRRCSVFAGGFRLEALEAVCALEGEDNWSVMDCLEELVKKSLVSVGERYEQARYSLLETIRQYAGERLASSGETSQLRDRHLSYFSGYACTNDDLTRGPGMMQAHANLSLEYENLLLALGWGIENAKSEALELATCLVSYWEMRSMKSEGVHWIEALLGSLAQFPAHAAGVISRRRAQQARLLAGLGLLQVNMIENTQAAKIARQGCDLARQSGNRNTLVICLSHLCLVSVFSGDGETAKSAIEEALAIARELEDSALVAECLNGQSLVTARVEHDPARMAVILPEFRQVARKVGNPFMIAMALYWQGIMEYRQGKLGEAQLSLQEASQEFSRVQSKQMENVTRSELGHLERQRGNVRQAAAIYSQTLPRWLEMGVLSPVAHQLECLAFLCMQCNEMKLALRLFGFAEGLRERSSNARLAEEEVEHQSAVSQLKAGLSSEEYGAAWISGMNMEMEETMQLAREVLEQLAGSGCEFHTYSD